MKLTLDISPQELADLIGLFQPKPEPEPEQQEELSSERIAAMLGLSPEEVQVVQPQADDPWAVAKAQPDQPLLRAGSKSYAWNEIPKDTRGNPSAYWMDAICPCGQKHGMPEDYEADTDENREKYAPKDEPKSTEGDGGYL